MYRYVFLLIFPIIRKKAFTGPVNLRYLAADIIDKRDPALREFVVAVRRRTNQDGSPSGSVEFTMAVARVPRSLRLLGYSYSLTPVIPPPRRCFTCQRFRHITNQFRSLQPICEFCSNHHRPDACPNLLRSAFCSNCCGDHVVSSRDCPVYQCEFEVSKYCYWNSYALARRIWVCGSGEFSDRVVGRMRTLTESLLGILLRFFVSAGTAPLCSPSGNVTDLPGAARRTGL